MDKDNKLFGTLDEAIAKILKEQQEAAEKAKKQTKIETTQVQPNQGLQR